MPRHSGTRLPHLCGVACLDATINILHSTSHGFSLRIAEVNIDSRHPGSHN
ncbi:hypothetical protein [Brevibacterium limosum]|uniref:hypothetical protein n=1 Tax=Brevibacterium limosum TaxID=2697565 RepID=UPI001AA12E02|nr:hypothetical protein [Brevibacterium limosum]